MDKTVTVDLWHFEQTFYAQGLLLVAGVDEAGRGPIAGPVVAASVILPKTFEAKGINDSKRLTEKQRESAFERLQREGLCSAIGIVDPVEIDAINILKATHLAMRRAVQSLGVAPDVILIDGLPVPNMADCQHLAIVGGDGLSVSIAAASIVAKVTRDRLMVEFARSYPEYGFDRHKGYASEYHRQALRKFGPCPIHRKSFAPVSNLVRASLFE